MSRKKKHTAVFPKKEKPPEGLEFYTRWQRCPDCELRDAVDITGKPRRDFDPFHKKLRRQGRVVNTTPRVVDDCETCLGSGRVRRDRSGDPMQDTR